MDGVEKLRRFLLAGALVGAAVGIAISPLMDVLGTVPFQGAWRDTIVEDMKVLFSLSLPRESVLVTAAFIVIILVLALFGSLMGMLLSFVIHRVFSILLKDESA